MAVAGGVPQAFSLINAELFARHAGEKCNGRRFFVTKSGRLGLGPRELRVVLLVGARVPFIVRTEDEEKERERYEADRTEREDTTEKGQDDKSEKSEGRAQSRWQRSARGQGAGDRESGWHRKS